MTMSINWRKFNLHFISKSTLVFWIKKRITTDPDSITWNMCSRRIRYIIWIILVIRFSFHNFQGLSISLRTNRSFVWNWIYNIKWFVSTNFILKKCLLVESFMCKENVSTVSMIMVFRGDIHKSDCGLSSINRIVAAIHKSDWG